MKYNIQHVIYRLTVVLESILACILLVAIGISVVGVVVNTDVMGLFNDSLTEVSAMQKYLSMVSTIVLCVEFVSMLCSHTVDSVVEVVLMAIARQVIVSHPAALDTLLMVLAIGLLFAIRKYLFVDALDSMHSHSHSLLFELFRAIKGEENKLADEHLKERTAEKLARAEAEAEELRAMIRTEEEYQKLEELLHERVSVKK
ncbi:MAG: hypothetical protein IJ452_08930 [Butyricicoccus sp.]|nr:hypothetical protein [Butyricicoccus sp.]